MQIKTDTAFYCVSLEHGEAGHITRFSLEELVNSVKGGTKLKAMAIFIGPGASDEADTYSVLVESLAMCQMKLKSLDAKQLDKALKAIEAIKETS